MTRALAERGYAGASVQEIARAAGITPGLVHYHFKTKEEILIAMVADMRARIEGRANTDDARGLIDALVAPSDDVRDKERVRAWACVAAEALTRPEVASVYRGVLEELTGRLVALGTPRTAALGIVCALEGYFHVAATCPELIERGSAAATLKALL